MKPSISHRLADQDRKERVFLLLATAFASILAWQNELGSFLLYPFTILATWFHEMGHGLAALLAGRGFERLLIFADGSGVAETLGPADGYRLTDALIAASGPLGPAVAGAALIIASRSPAATRYALAALGAALVLSTLIWVRSPIGWLVLPAFGLAILALALRGSEPWRRFAIQLLGIQAAISAWQQFDYLFSPGGNIGGELHRSDTGAIADALLLPYWFWGAALSAAILALLWGSLRLAFAKPPESRGRLAKRS
ncbi:MAG: M50 family metallopeptidase [Allosphingosinicella sp.]